MRPATALRGALPLAALVLALTSAAPASADTDFKFTLSAAAPTVKWDGTNPGLALNLTAQGLGEPTCAKDPLEYCDTILINATEPGTFTAKGTMDAATDVDFYLYASDASGMKGKLLKSDGQGAGMDENVKGGGEAPGYYLLVVSFFTSLGTTYKGELQFTSTGPVPAGGATGASGAAGPDKTAPTSAIRSFGKSIKAAKLTGFSGKAKDDGTVKKVEVAVLRLDSKGKCSSLTAAGTFKAGKNCKPKNAWLPASGTTAWSFTLRKPFAKGSYVVYSRATDAANNVESKVTASNARPFKVK